MLKLLVLRVFLLKKIVLSIAALRPVKHWLQISPRGLIIRVEDKAKGRLDFVIKIDDDWFGDYSCDTTCAINLDMEQFCSAFESVTEDESLAVVVGDDFMEAAEIVGSAVLEFMDENEVTKSVTVGVKKQLNVPWSYDNAINIHEYRVFVDPKDFAYILQHAIESCGTMVITITGYCLFLGAGAELITLQGSEVVAAGKTCVLHRVAPNMNQTLEVGIDILRPVHFVAREAEYICIHETARVTDNRPLIECSFGQHFKIVFFLPRPAVVMGYPS